MGIEISHHNLHDPGEGTFASAHDRERTKDPAKLRQWAKVTLIPDEALEREMPLRVAIVELTFEDGIRKVQRVDNVRGTPENPMTHDEVVAKARDLISPILGLEKCSQLTAKIFQLETVRDIRELRPLLQT